MTLPDIKVKEIATMKIISLDANATMEEVGKKMYAEQVSMLVITENGKVAGLITAGEWFKSFYLHVGCHLPETKYKTSSGPKELEQHRIDAVKKRAHEFKKTKVREIMNTHFKTVLENSSIIDAVHEMKAKELRRLLVVDEKGEVTGVLGRVKTITKLLEAL